MPGYEPSLGGELVVDVHHRVAGKGEVGGQRPRRGQPGADGQAAVGDGFTQCLLERTLATGAPQFDVEIDSMRA